MVSYKGLTVYFLGDLNYYSKGYSRLNAFKRLGACVVDYSHAPLGGERAGYTEPSIAFRIAWKLGVHLDTERVNEWLMRVSDASAPSLIWIEKGNMIRPAVLEYLRSMCPKALIASYSDDDMLNWSNRTWAYTRGLKKYDVVFTTKSYNADSDELPLLGAQKVVVVDKAFDRDQHRPQLLSDEEIEKYSSEVGFIGSFETPRAGDIEYLAQNGVPIRVWGNGWDKFSSDQKNLTIERRALVNTSQDALYSKGICATKINLAFLRKANRDLHTARSIEIPACGGFLLAEYSDEHARLFKEGEEAVYFRDRDELLQKIRYYLLHEDERQRIAARGLERCRSDRYSHDDRVAFMLKSLFPDIN